MKTTLTIENDGTTPTGIEIEQAHAGGTVTRHFLEAGQSMTVTTSAWPLRVMDSLGGHFSDRPAFSNTRIVIDHDGLRLADNLYPLSGEHVVNLAAILGDYLVDPVRHLDMRIMGVR